jgi:MFS family permease
VTTGPTPPPSAWSPLRQSLFRDLWIASVASNVGTWMQNVGATWLMASLTPSPLLVALMQTATSLPIFLVGLPAGAMADIVDRRRLLLFAQAWMLAAAAILGVLTIAGYASPWALLALTFALGIGGAMNSPVWQAMTPELVARADLPAAVALSSISFNIARAVGPAIGGVVVSAAGPGICFLLNAASFLGVLVVIYRWRRPRGTSSVPGERMLGAVRTGARYVRYAPELRAVLVRTAVFVTCSSALWALLPVVARDQLQFGSLGYGVLLGFLGLGAIVSAFALPGMRRRLSNDGQVVVATVLFAVGSVALGLTHWLPLVFLAMAAGGAGWMIFTSSVNVVAITAAAPWVRARALGAYMLVFQGCFAGGSALWGVLAGRIGEAEALIGSGVVLALGLAAGLRWSLAPDHSQDLRPSRRRTPLPALDVEPAPEEGPVLVTMEYEVAPEYAANFIHAMQEVGLIRRRNGSSNWGLFRDPGNPRRFLETFVSESWAEHLRQHERLTVADRTVEERALAFHQGGGPPAVSHYIYARDQFGRDQPGRDQSAREPRIREA